jgi:hypothetical protein
MTRIVWFIDTSVLCELLEVPGKAQQAAEVKTEAQRRLDAGARFVLPMTAVIETGNHICNARTGRRSAAERFVGLMEAVRSGTHGWALHEVSWDAEFLGRLMDGSPDWERFVDLAGSGRMGSGDLAILAERERFRRAGAFRDVRIWTLERELGAYS